MEILENNNTKRNISNYKKLGFTYLETAELSVKLKQLLAEYQMFYHKLRNFHWNIEGSEFFELHEQFEMEYNEVKESIDILAERIRVFGIKPSLTLKEVNEMSKIQEHYGKNSAMDMLREILQDFEIIHEQILDALGVSLDNGDVASEQMLTDFIRRIEKRNWMYSAFLK